MMPADDLNRLVENCSASQAYPFFTMSSKPLRYAAELITLPLDVHERGLFATGLVEPDGIEPTTSCLQSRRSPN